MKEWAIGPGDLSLEKTLHPSAHNHLSSGLGLHHNLFLSICHCVPGYLHTQSHYLCCPLLFLQENGYIWEQQINAIRDMWSNGEPSPVTQRRRDAVMDLGGAVVNKESIGGNWKFGVLWLFTGSVTAVSQWLSCYWAKEESFLPCSEVVM